MQSGAGWGCSLKGINVSLVFFFLNKKLGFCQHRFLQKTSTFPEKIKIGSVFHQRAHLEERVGNGSVNHKASVTTKPA